MKRHYSTTFCERQGPKTLKPDQGKLNSINKNCGPTQFWILREIKLAVVVVLDDMLPTSRQDIAGQAGHRHLLVRRVQALRVNQNPAWA